MLQPENNWTDDDIKRLEMLPLSDKIRALNASIDIEVAQKHHLDKDLSHDDITGILKFNTDFPDKISNQCIYEDYEK